MPRKYSFLQVFWPAIVAGGTLTILLGIWTFNTFLPSEGESIQPDSLKIIWFWLVGGLLITAASVYFCHTRLRALSKSLEDLTGLIPELHVSQSLHIQFLPGFLKVTGFQKLNFFWHKCSKGVGSSTPKNPGKRNHPFNPD